MTPERYQRIVDLFRKIVEVGNDRRDLILDESCAGDEDLRKEVHAMLAAHEQAANVSETPPDDLTTAVMDLRQARSLIGQKLGEYEVTARLGSGGMGEVFLAVDNRLRRKVALKLLPEEYTTDPVRLRRLEEEARAVSTLNHPNIVTIHGIGQAGMITFLVTEFVPGLTLRHQMATGPLPPKQVIDIAIQVVAALAVAHDAGVVHRDIKPENIMVRPDGLVKILDFGVAKTRELPGASRAFSPSSELNTARGIVVGTPRYMSPEQARGLHVDRRTDIFSVGCLLYELLSGFPTVTGATPGDVIAAILTQQPAPVESFCPDCPAGLSCLITRAMKKDCDERYQSCEEMLSDLKRASKEIESGVPRPPASRIHYRAALVSALLILIVAVAAILYRRDPGPSLESIAILPFINEGGADLQYVADGLTDTLIGDLSQVPKLKVISRNSVLRYKDREVDPALTGAALKTQAVLVGRVGQKGDRLSVRLELVDVRDNHRLWGELYNCVSADLIQTQADIAKEVLTKLHVTLGAPTQRDLRRRQKIKPEAYRLYLQGKFYFNRLGLEETKKAIALFHEALQADPTYALAYVALANSYIGLASEVPPKEVMPRAREYALKALELDVASSEAHVVLGLVKLLYDWDWPGAQSEFKHDSHLNPEAVGTFPCYLHSGDTMGRSNEALAELTSQLARDPLSSVNNVEVVCSAYYARQYDRAISHYWRTINLDPGIPIAYANVGRAYVQKHQYSEAIAELEKGSKLDPGSPLIQSELAYALAASGKMAAARNIITQMKTQSLHKYVDPFLIAPVYIPLGEPEEAFEWLEKAYAERSSGMPWLQADPKFDPVRSDPRYRELLRRVGFRS